MVPVHTQVALWQGLCGASFNEKAVCIAGIDEKIIIFDSRSQSLFYIHLVEVRVIRPILIPDFIVNVMFGLFQL